MCLCSCACIGKVLDGKKLPIIINALNFVFAWFLCFCKKEIVPRWVGLSERLLVSILNFLIILEVSFCYRRKHQIEDEKKK